MRILLTNDDGVFAPGLRALRRELQKLGDVTVVAPATEQSAAGHSITIHHPLVVQPARDENGEPMGWAVEGRPADCVKLALQELLPEPPELVVSGLNSGSNAGINILYSGTVAAAVEGAFYRVTSVATSLEYVTAGAQDFPAGATLARQVIEGILAHRPPTGSLFNVNVPALDKGPVKGVRVAPQNINPYREEFSRRTDPRGRIYFWAEPELHAPEPHPDSDVTLLEEGFITVTPLQFDVTRHAMLAELAGWRWHLVGAHEVPG